MRGFTLLEVMIATAIASTISVVLFVALRQTMGYQERVDTLVDTYTRATLIQNQFERDFMGFFVPSEAYELVATKTGGKTSGREKAEQIDKIFYATKDKEQFGMLSFITTNAMQVYWGKTMGMPKPLVARVVYRLVPDKSHEGSTVRQRLSRDSEGSIEGPGGKTNSYVLTRQESKKLDIAPFEGGPEKQKVRAYDIVSDVKSMKVVYGARVYKNENEGSTQASPKATPGKASEAGSSSSVRPEEMRDKSLPSWTYKEFTEWDWSPKKAKPKDKDKSVKAGEKKNESPAQKETVSRVPMYIKVNLELWNPEHTRSTPFEFLFMRKPFEMEELEKDELDKPAPAMPNLKPMFDMLKMPMGGQQGAMAAPRVVTAQAPALHQRIPGLPNQNRGIQNRRPLVPGMKNPIFAQVNQERK